MMELRADFKRLKVVGRLESRLGVRLVVGFIDMRIQSYVRHFI